MARFGLDRRTDYLYHLHVYDIDVQRNEVWINANEQLLIGAGGENLAEPGVEPTMASRFIKNMQVLRDLNPESPVLIHLKTCGGSWEEGMAMYDAIRAHPTHVTVVNWTHARSMSSLIFLAGDRRVMMPHSCFMFHEGTVEFQGTARQFRTEEEWGRKATARMVEIYAEALGGGKLGGWTSTRRKKWVRDQMRAREEVYLDAEEAIELGFAHALFESWESIHG